MLCVVVFALSGCGLLKPDTTNDSWNEEVRRMTRVRRRNKTRYSKRKMQK